MQVRAGLVATGAVVILSATLTFVAAPAAAAATSPVAASSSHGRGNPSGPKADQLRHKAEQSGLTGSQSATAPSATPPNAATAGTLLAAATQNASLAQIATIGGAWHSIGPAPLTSYRGGFLGIGAAAYPNDTGRVLALTRSGNTIYLGAADGGIWKSTDMGGHWTPLGDHLASLAIGAIAVSPDGSTILAGTGELADAFDAIRGVGVYRSTDGGQTWTLSDGKDANGVSLFQNQAVSAIRFDPSKPTRVFAAHTSGIAVSADGGATWSALTDANVNKSIMTDLAVDSAGNLFAAHGAPGDSANGVYYSTDHGATWAHIESYGSNTWVWKLDLAASTAGNARSGQVVYAVAGDTSSLGSHLAGIFRSTDGGQHWSTVATASSLGDSSSQAWYDIYVAINPTNANDVFVGLIDIYRSIDGGSSWSNTTNVYSNFLPLPAAIHPDQHAALWMGSTILFGNDGGVYESGDNGDSYSSDNGAGLVLGQYYGGDISATSSSEYLGGLQDNGNSLTTNAGRNWTDLTSGDGFWTVIDYTNPKNLYMEYSNDVTGHGQPEYSIDQGASFTNACNNTPAICRDPARFSTPLVMDPSNSSVLYSAHSQHLWKTTDGMITWTSLPSPTGGNNPSALAVAPTNSRVIYLGDEGANVWISTDGGSTWTSIDAACGSATGPNCSGGEISSLTVDPSDSRVVHAAVNGFRAGATGQHIFRSRDSGATWQDISTRLPNVPFQSMAIDLTNTSTLYAGSDMGVYISEDAGTTWSVLGSFLPNARVFHISMRGNQLIAWTHGRGAWRLDLTTVPPAPFAIVALPTPGGGDACRTTPLPRNDDNSSTAVNLGFAVNFFGQSYSSGYVNNNGNFTFDTPLFNYTPFPLTTTQHVIVAPYFGDVDTRALGSDIVTYSYGNGTYFGHKAFCVDWVNVGYYFMHTDKLDSFQLLLVDRSDTGAGNFDIYFNYDKIQWETGDASGGINGLGGFSARVGYSNGTTASFELPGSATNGYFLDSSPTALIKSSRLSTVPGRYIFPVRSGVAPTGGTITGTIYANSVSPANTVSFARVQACNFGGFCWITTSESTGFYSISGLPFDFYTITVYPPNSMILNPGTLGPFVLAANQVLTGQDVILRGPSPPPPGTSLSPSVSTTSGGLPVVYWSSPLTMTTTGCTGGTATYQIMANGTLARQGQMSEGPAGTYTAAIPPLMPNHGNAQVSISLHCPDGSTVNTNFDMYIDPSGTVTTTTGQPLAGATVTLLRSDSSSGPFSAVPDGDSIMSPANRHNPDVTDSQGHFGWDVLTGYYIVTASHPGCTASNDPTQTDVQSQVLSIPPPATGLTLQLLCVGAPMTTASLSPQPNAAGWNHSDVTVTLNATASGGGPAIQGLSYSATGAQVIPSTDAAGSQTTVTITAEGTTVLTFFAHDVGGNSETSKQITIKLDKTPPAITTTRTPAANSFGWNNTDVTVSFSCTDQLSGVDTFSGPTTLSNEGAEQSVTGTCSDIAGNTATAKVDHINIDKTSPTTTASVSPTPNGNGWNNATVTVTLTATDALSGVDVTNVVVDGGAVQPYASPLTISTEGVHNIFYWSRDRAGNIESTHTLAVKVDKTPPEAYIQFDPVSLDLQVFGRDSLSGVEPGPVTATSAVPGQGQDQIRSYRITDHAGNTLDLVLDVIPTGDHLQATVTSLSYDGGAPVKPVDNTFQFEWSGTAGAAPDKLNQRFDVGQGTDHVQVTANWGSTSGQTVIKQTTSSTTVTGLVLLRMATSSGQVSIEVPGPL